MDGPKTVTATWRTDSTVLYVTVIAVVVAIALVTGTALYLSTKHGKGTETAVQAGSNVENPRRA